MSDVPRYDAAALRGRKALVAGGTGLVGAGLSLRLQALGADWRATHFSRAAPFHPERFLHADLPDLDACVEATRGMQDLFICAAQTFGAKMMKERPTALVLPNLKINASLLEAARISGVERVLFISSSTVYPLVFHPIREDELDLNQPPFELYVGVGGMKRYIEQLCRFYASRYGMKIGIIRPTNIYGPWDKFEDDKSHVLPALIKRALAREDPYVVWGTGNTVRDFVFVDDFVEDVLGVLERYSVCDPINVSSGTTIRIREAVEVILKVTGHAAKPVFDATKPEAIPFRTLSTIKYESLFGRPARTTFAEGIAKTVAWYRGTLGK